MDKCKYCALQNCKPCYECSACKCGDDHFIKSSTPLTDSELTITDPADQLQVALNALELAERESETLKAENEKLNETLAIYKNRYDVCNEY